MPARVRATRAPHMPPHRQPCLQPGARCGTCLLQSPRRHPILRCRLLQRCCRQLHRQRVDSSPPKPGISVVLTHDALSRQLPSFSEPSWRTVVLVCKACKKRKNAPKKLKSGELLREIQYGVRGINPKPRVVAATCLGLCPKRATAIALVTGIGAPHITAVAARSQISSFCALAADLLNAQGR